MTDDAYVCARCDRVDQSSDVCCAPYVDPVSLVDTGVKCDLPVDHLGFHSGPWTDGIHRTWF